MKFMWLLTNVMQFYLPDIKNKNLVVLQGTLVELTWPAKATCTYIKCKAHAYAGEIQHFKALIEAQSPIAQSLKIKKTYSEHYCV